MSKIVDITEKLNFNENPVIVIRGQELEVNTDAETVLKIMGIIGDGDSIQPKEIISMYELIFSEKDRAKLDKLKLTFADFQTVVFSAISLITGEGEEQGEQ